MATHYNWVVQGLIYTYILEQRHVTNVNLVWWFKRHFQVNLMFLKIIESTYLGRKTYCWFGHAFPIFIINFICYKMMQIIRKNRLIVSNYMIQGNLFFPLRIELILSMLKNTGILMFTYKNKFIKKSNRMVSFTSIPHHYAVNQESVITVALWLKIFLR